MAEGVVAWDEYTKNGAITCSWHLRTPGKSQNASTYVFNDGSIAYIGDYVNDGSGCVRPAIWVSLES